MSADNTVSLPAVKVTNPAKDTICLLTENKVQVVPDMSSSIDSLASFDIVTPSESPKNTIRLIGGVFATSFNALAPSPMINTEKEYVKPTQRPNLPGRKYYVPKVANRSLADLFKQEEDNKTVTHKGPKFCIVTEDDKETVSVMDDKPIDKARPEFYIDDCLVIKRAKRAFNLADLANE